MLLREVHHRVKNNLQVVTSLLTMQAGAATDPAIQHALEDAGVLGISVHTARNHLKSVFRKLNLHSQDELLRFLLGVEAV
jgi:two-component sensor histidine kinase